MASFSRGSCQAKVWPIVQLTTNDYTRGYVMEVMTRRRHDEEVSDFFLRGWILGPSRPDESQAPHTFKVLQKKKVSWAVRSHGESSAEDFVIHALLVYSRQRADHRLHGLQTTYLELLYERFSQHLKMPLPHPIASAYSAPSFIASAFRTSRSSRPLGQPQPRAIKQQLGPVQRVTAR
jgi:hypothetical protein